MRVVCVSDTHGYRPALPEGDLLVHAGDGYCDFTSSWWPLHELLMSWPGPFVYVPGNHDPHNPPVQCLVDDEELVAGLRVYGMPWTPRYGRWHHMLDRGGDELRARVEAIPEGLDILVTHGPPLGTLDGARLGCELLAEHLATMRAPPKLHVFGHIHEGYGISEGSVNAAHCDTAYKPRQAPIVVEL
jgi:predicted phosphodiesterase